MVVESHRIYIYTYIYIYLSIYLYIYIYIYIVDTACDTWYSLSIFAQHIERWAWKTDRKQFLNAADEELCCQWMCPAMLSMMFLPHSATAGDGMKGRPIQKPQRNTHEKTALGEKHAELPLLHQTSPFPFAMLERICSVCDGFGRSALAKGSQADPRRWSVKYFRHRPRWWSLCLGCPGVGACRHPIWWRLAPLPDQHPSNVSHESSRGGSG